MLKAINKIAQRIEQARPDITVEYLSYTKETSTVPEDILPHKNIAVLVANTGVAKAWLKKSKRAGARGVYCLHYHLADNIAERGNLPLRFEATSDDCRRVKKDGLKGIVPFYIGLDTWWRSSLNLYVFAQCSWDTSKNIKSILTDYCKRYYGDAAQEMYALLKSLEKEIPNIQTPVDWPLWQEWKELRTILSEENWDKLKKVITKQRDLLSAARMKTDGAMTKRFNAVSSYINFVELWLNAFHERALSSIAFDQKNRAAVRKHIVNALKQEECMNKLLNLSGERYDGVNGPAVIFHLFQNKRMQLDKQLLEMKIKEKKEKINDNDPDIETFLPGILEKKARKPLKIIRRSK